MFSGGGSVCSLVWEWVLLGAQRELFLAFICEVLEGRGCRGEASALGCVLPPILGGVLGHPSHALCLVHGFDSQILLFSPSAGFVPQGALPRFREPAEPLRLEGAQ